MSVCVRSKRLRKRAYRPCSPVVLSCGQEQCRRNAAYRLDHAARWMDLETVKLHSLSSRHPPACRWGGGYTTRCQVLTLAHKAQVLNSHTAISFNQNRV
jgi:hypothetical protein